MGCFTRLMVFPKATIHAIGHCRRVLVLDGTHLKHKTVNTLVVLLLTCRDASNKILILSFAVVKSESEESWGWFLRKCTELCPVIGEWDDLVVVSDRDK